ncbi:MAG: hypothetical protein IAE67_08000, partial [Candidatus Competibacteraceae bacterium]|nr:hypothetical protein [Candidatus Competibacteraceae bacterium]
MKKHVLFLLIIFWWHLSATGQSTSERSGDNPFYGFIENRGQIIDQNQEINNSVRYLLNRPGFNLQLKNNSFSYDTYEKTGAIDFAFHRVDIVLQNANPNPTIIASGEANDVINYYYPHIAVSGVKHFENIIYKDIYPQIDLEFFLTEVDGKNWFEYQFIIHPGGRIQDIVLDYQGEKSISLQEEKIIIEVNQGSFHEFIPLSYLQESKEKVDVKFMLDETQQISFILETDVNWIDEDGICMNTLVIDPTPMVSWSTYYGGVGDEGHSSIGVSGTNVCLTGTTTSSNPGNIISTQGASPFNNISGGIDGYLAMFTTGGSRMWGTYYGGTGDDYITGVVNTGNDVYVCGYTNSTGLIGSGGLATSGAYATANAGGNDMFIARFNSVASGSHVWGTYYGGAGDDKATDIVLSGSDLYISGYSNSSPGVSMGAVFQSVKSNSYDATLLKMNTAGTPSLCTFYGGNGDDYGNSVKVNAGASTEVWVCGTTSSTNLITTTGPATNSGGTDIFVFRTNTLLNTLTTSRYFGGAGNETGEDLAATVISAVSRIYVIGTTNSSGLGTAGTFKPNYSNNGSEAIVVNFSNTGIVNWASYYGDEEMNWSDDQGTAIDINNAGTLIIGGNTAGSNVQLNNYISYPNAIQTGRVDYRDCFLARLNYLNGTRIFGTFYASTGDDYLTDISVSSTCNFYATGVVNSGGGLWNNGAGPGYATSGAYQTGNASDGAWLTQFTAADSVSAYIAPISPSICSGASVNLSASGGVSYNWSTFESSSTISVSPATTTTYTVTVTSACGGTATASVTVTVSSTPPTATAGNDGPKCVGQTLLLNSSGGSSYSWSGPNGFLSSSQNPSISNIQLLNGGVYTVTVTDASGCTATATTSVTVNANPTVSISGTTTICNGQSTSLTASGGGT